MRGEDPPEAAATPTPPICAGRSARTAGSISCLLGLGHDGHTASLFPGLAAVTETRRTVMESYVEFVGMWRLSLTPVAINAARRVLFVVTGDDKAEILRRVLKGRASRSSCPRRRSARPQRPATWLLDRAGRREA